MSGRWLLRTAAVLAAVVLAAEAGGVVARGRGAPPRAGGPGRARGPVVDEEMRAALEQVMKVRLRQVLQLTPGQEERVMPRVDRLQEARHDFATRRRAAVAHLRAVMTDETSRPGDIEKALREVRDLESSFRERESTLREDIDAELDARQRARLYFFEVRFRREMQRRLVDATGPGAAPHAGPGPGPVDRGGPGAPPAQEADPDGAGDDGL